MNDPVDEHAQDWETMFQAIAHELEADIARERADAAMRHARRDRLIRLCFALCACTMSLIVLTVVVLMGK